jgi:hypothetical protein
MYRSSVDPVGEIPYVIQVMVIQYFSAKFTGTKAIWVHRLNQMKHESLFLTLMVAKCF